ncbi:MAG: hypothetical protein ACOCZ6_05645 [Nanoarchaeota archaeon]
MRNSPYEIIPLIINTLRNGSQTLTKLQSTTDINRVTLSNYIASFEKAGIIKTKKHGRERLIQLRSNPDSYFDLPVDEEDTKYISTIYAYIRQTCLKLYNKEPTKTQVYKIIYELKKPLPIGWYQYGPCPVRIYRGNEKKEKKLGKDDLSLIKKKVKEYCALSNFELQKRIYNKENNHLYQLKEKLITLDKPKKDELNILLTELIQNVPGETIKVTTDFVRAAFLLGWDKARLIFRDYIWKFISIVVFKESLKHYYGEDIEELLGEKIKETKEEARKTLYWAVKGYMDSKYSGDKYYQQYVKRHQSHHH